MTQMNLVLTASLLLACGSEPPTQADVDGGPGEEDSADSGSLDSGETAAITFACPGGAIVPGQNSLMVGGRMRELHVAFPSDMSRPMGVVFSWYGFGGNATDFRTAVALDPDSVPSLPLVIVTPTGTGLLPPQGLDWDLRLDVPVDENVDLPFFEAMLGCLNEQYNLDPAAIYSFGFSAGSVMTSLLHSRYPTLFSAVVAESGAWFNDPVEEDLVNLFSIEWNWPELVPADGGAVLLTHGGPSDVTVLNILDLEKAAQAAFPFLKAAGRTVVDCAHGNGHTLHPEVTPALVTTFLTAHRANQPSPYLTGGFTGFPASCTLRSPTE